MSTGHCDPGSVGWRKAARITDLRYAMTARLAVTSPGYALFAASSMNRYDYEKQGRVREAVLQDPASPKAGLVNCRSLPWWIDQISARVKLPENMCKSPAHRPIIAFTIMGAN